MMKQQQRVQRKNPIFNESSKKREKTLISKVQEIMLLFSFQKSSKASSGEFFLPPKLAKISSTSCCC